VRLLPESGQVLLAAAILSASIIVRPAQPVIANTPELPTIVVEQQPPVVNITHEPPDIFIEVQPSVVNLPPSVTNEPVTVIVEPAPVLPAQVIYEDRTVEVERIVEVRTCLDFAELPYFDLANALSVAFPGASWSLSGSHYPGLTWHDDSPKPDMTAIIAGWLAFLESRC
jgi:hypothetical protein